MVENPQNYPNSKHYVRKSVLQLNPNDHKKYLEWQLTTGRKQSFQTFAKYLGVSYSTMMGWMNDTHPHRFRHFYASEMAADDMTEFNLMQNLGQTSNKMARRYVHLEKARTRKRPSIVDKLKKR